MATTRNRLHRKKYHFQEEEEEAEESAASTKFTVQTVETLSPQKQAGYNKARRQLFGEATLDDILNPEIPDDDDIERWMTNTCETDPRFPTQYCRTHGCKAHLCPSNIPDQSPSGPLTIHDSTPTTPLSGIIAISDSETEGPDENSDNETPIKKKQKRNYHTELRDREIHGRGPTTRVFLECEETLSDSD